MSFLLIKSLPISGLPFLTCKKKGLDSNQPASISKIPSTSVSYDLRKYILITATQMKTWEVHKRNQGVLRVGEGEIPLSQENSG